jgi:hypothetical protein
MKYVIPAILSFATATIFANCIGCAGLKSAAKDPAVATIAVAACQELVQRQGRPDLAVLCSTMPQMLDQLIGEAKRAGQCK